jgi:hypothetical protein
MIRKTVKTMLYFWQIVLNYDYLVHRYNAKTLTKSDLRNHATKQEKDSYSNSMIIQLR